MLTTLFTLSRSKIVKGTLSNNFQTQNITGYATFDCISRDNKTLKLTYLSIGQELQLGINGKKYYPSNYQGRIDEENVNINLILEKITEYDYYIKYQIINLNKEPINVSLGSFVEWEFKGQDGELTVGPLNKQEGYYLQSSINPSYQKLIIDHSRYDNGNYYNADNYWYGNYGDIPNTSTDSKYTMKIADKKTYTKTGNFLTDYAFSCSWTERTVTNHITFGFRIYIVYDSEFDLAIPNDNNFAAGKVNDDNIELLTLVRPIEKDIIYKEYIGNGDDGELKETGRSFSSNSNNNGLKTMENWRIYFNPEKNVGVYKMRCAIKYNKSNVEHTSNIQTVEITRSEQPTLIITDGISEEKEYTHSQKIHVNFNAQFSTKEAFVDFEFWLNGQMVNKQTSGRIVNPTPATLQTIPGSHDISLESLSSGTYQLKITLRNMYHNPSQTQTKSIKVDFKTYIQSIRFDNNVKSPGEKITLYATYVEKDLEQKVHFKVKFGDMEPEIESGAYQTTGTTQTISFEMNVPKSLKQGDITCTVSAFIQDNKMYQDVLPLKISGKPSFNVINLQGNKKIFETSDFLNFSFEGMDDSDGFIKWDIMGAKSGNISFRPNERIPDLQISLNGIPYNKRPYSLQIYAIDSYNVQSDPFYLNFEILSKPEIQVEMPINVSKPNEPVPLTVKFNDTDYGKDLYLYANYGGVNHYIDHRASDPKNPSKQVFNTQFYFPSSSGKYDVNFFITNKYNKPYSEDNSYSKMFLVKIISTKKPDLEVKGPEYNFFTKDEKILLVLTIRDDESGQISYKVGDRPIVDQTDLVNQYNATGFTSITIQVKVNITGLCSYSVDNTPCRLKVQLTDNYGVESDEKSYSFHVRNKPVINEIYLEKSLIITEPGNIDNKVVIYGKFTDEDRGKVLKFSVQEDNKPTQIIQTIQDITSNGETKEFNFTYKLQSISGMNIPLYIWMDSDFDKSLNEGNTTDSIRKILKINITQRPSIDFECPSNTENGIGYDETKNILVNVSDESIGKLIVKFDGEIIKNLELGYNGSIKNLNVPIKFPRDYARGKHVLSIYPIDEYGVEQNENSRKTCNIFYRSKPVINRMDLNVTQADNDDPVSVTGSITDYDSEKVLHIFQKIGEQQPIEIGAIKSEGHNSIFTLNIKNLEAQGSGNTPIVFFASSSSDPNDIGGNVRSDLFNTSIFMANHPLLVVEPVDKKYIYGTGEKISININITSDRSGTLKIYQYQNIINTTDYSGNISFTHEITGISNPEKLSLVFEAIGANNTNSGRKTLDLVIKDAPILTTITGNSVVSPDSFCEIEYGYDFKGDTMSQTFYLFAQIKGQTEIFVSEGFRPDNTKKKSHKVKLPSFTTENKFTIYCWIQNTHYVTNPPENNSKSDILEHKVQVTGIPTVTVYLSDNKTEYGYKDELSFVYLIVDDTEEGHITILIDNKNVSYVPYNNRYKKESRLNIKLSQFKYNPNNNDNYIKHGDHNVEFQVEDKFGMKCAQTFSIKILSKPRIISVDLSNRPYIPGESVTVEFDFGCDDKDRDLSFYYEVDGRDPQVLTPARVTSNSSESQKFNGTFTVPDITGTKQFTFFIASYGNSSDGASMTSNKVLTITFTPQLNLNELQKKYYKQNDQIEISGSLSADGQATIYFGEECKAEKSMFSLQFDNAQKDFTNFRRYLDLNNKLSYGQHTLKAWISSKSRQSQDCQEIQFNVRNKPIIKNVDFGDNNIGAISVGGYKYIYVNISDNDVGKELYLYWKVGDNEPEELDYVTIGQRGPPYSVLIPYYSDYKGQKQIQIWATEDRLSEKSIEESFNNLDDLKKSNIINTGIIFTYIPDITCEFPKDIYFYSPNSTISYKIDCEDDGKIIINHVLKLVDNDENEIIIHNSSEVVKVNGKLIITRNITVPNNASYRQIYKLSVSAKDQYGFSNSEEQDEKDENTFDFSIMNSPTITDVKIPREFALLGENLQITVNFNDPDDTKRLYLFVQLGENRIEDCNERLTSNGTNGQEISTIIKIPEDYKTGPNNIKVWLSGDKWSSEYKYVPPKTSIAKNKSIRISYKPSIKLEELKKVIYKDGDKVYLTGNANANSDLNLHYYIDSTYLNHSSYINVYSIPQEFTTEFVIPPFFKYGNYTVTVIGTDNLNQQTNPVPFTIEIRNPPRILNASAANAEVNQGEVLKVTGYVHDPDINNSIQILARVDTGNEDVYQIINSTSQSMQFSINVVLPSGIEEGPHKIYLKAIDQDGEVSKTFSLDFTVIIPTVEENTNNETNNFESNDSEQKSDKSVMNGLYIGVGFVAAMLIILIVIIVIIFNKKKNAPPVYDQEDSNVSDLEERETQVMSTQSAINPDEIATKDNPLFSSREITHDEDPFEDEFEEEKNAP